MQAEGSKKRFIWLTVIGVLLNVAAIGYLRYQVTLPNLLHIPTSSQIRADMMSSCGIVNPAFCDSFSIPHPGGRGGDLDDSKWSFYRATQNGNDNASDAFPWTDEMFCKTPISGVLPDLDSFFCNNNGQEEMHWMTSMNGTDYVYVGARIRQPFDFANRTGTVAFSVDAVTRGSHSWWPEIEITDTPVMGPHSLHPAVNGTPQNGIDLALNAGCNISNGITDATGVSIPEIGIYNNYAITYLNSSSPNVCIKTKRDNHNMFQMKISQNEIQIYGSDYDSTTLQLLATFNNVNLNFTRGYLNFQEAAYSADKFNGDSDMTYHWHDIGFDGPVLPTPRSYEIPDANTFDLAQSYSHNTGVNSDEIGLGYRVSAGGTSVCCNIDGNGSYYSLIKQPLTFHGVDLTNAQSAMLELNTSGIGGGDTFLFRINGNGWHTVSHPMAPIDGTPSDATNPGWFPWAIPVPVNELQNGDNTVTFAYPSSTNPSGYTVYDVANIDLELFGDAITAPDEPLVTPAQAAYMDVIPSHTDPLVPLVFGTPTPISVTMHAEDLSADMQKAAATVTLSSRLKVQSVTPGDCGMNFDKTPTTSDLSFSGTIQNDTTTACTVFTAMIVPTAQDGEWEGNDYVNLSNASIMATSGEQILAAVHNGTYRDYVAQDQNAINVTTFDGRQEIPMIAPGQSVNIGNGINNTNSTPITVMITNTVYDPNGKVLATFATSSPASAQPGGYPVTGGNVGTYTTLSNAQLGIYHVGTKVLSGDGKTVLYDSPEAATFILLPSISESTTVTPSAITTGSTVTVTPTVTMKGAMPAIVQVEVVDPNNLIYKKLLNNDQPINFVANTPVSQGVSFTMPADAPYGTYSVHVSVLSADQQYKYYEHTYTTQFNVAANALSITSPVDTYNSSITIQGSKLSATTRIQLTDANGNDLSSSITYPDSAHFQFTLPLNDYLVHTYTLVGFDAANTPTPSFPIQIHRHKLGDIDGYGGVNLVDLSIFAKDWHRGVRYGNTLYNPLSDMNNDGNVDISDLSILAKNWGS